MKTIKIICAGFGGQGIMTLGKMLTALGASSDTNVTWMPSYGAEVRGGTAHSMVIISNEEIPSPIVSEADICVVMNKPSFDKFQPRVKQGGMIILNSSLIEDPAGRKDIKIIKVPATQTAYSLGNIKAANVVILGAIVSATKIASKAKALTLLEEFFSKKKDLLELNKKAFLSGFEGQK